MKVLVAGPVTFGVWYSLFVRAELTQMAKSCAMPASLLMTVTRIGWPATAAMHFVFHEMCCAVSVIDEPVGVQEPVPPCACFCWLTQAWNRAGVRTSSTSFIFECQRPQN